MSPADLRSLFSEAGYQLKGFECVVPTFGGRSQRIAVDSPEDGLLKLSTIVARGSKAREAGFGHAQCWERNRLSELVGLRVGTRGEVIAEAWVPVVGLMPAVLQLYMHHVAVASDRWEHQITGEDSH
jgi:hypothetical protein